MQSTLAAAFNDLTGDVGNHLGYGRGENNGDSAWDDLQQRAITQCVKGGMRKFYHCGYDWSFLHPNATLTLGSGEKLLLLPDDFGGLEGGITVSTSSGGGYERVPIVPDVRHKYAVSPTATGWPQMACFDPEKTTGRDGQKQRLLFFPAASQEFTVEFRYYLNPDYLTGTRPYAYGGPQHAETLLAACKATAEIDFDDMTQGPQWLEFMRLLEASKLMDRRNQSQLIGYNGDRSDMPRRRYRTQYTATLAGVEPD